MPKLATVIVKVTFLLEGKNFNKEKGKDTPEIWNRSMEEFLRLSGKEKGLLLMDELGFEYPETRSVFNLENDVLDAFVEQVKTK